MLSYQRLTEAIAGERLPLAFVDLDAFDRNLSRVLGDISAHGLPLRVASKSLRVPALLRRLIERGEGRLRGLLCYCAEEAEHLAQQGFDDLLVAYPAYQESDLEILAGLCAAGHNVSVVADSRRGIERISKIAVRHATAIRVVLCVDMSLRLLGGRVHLGVRRSPLHRPEQVVNLARFAAEQPGCEFWGLMGYEAQVAGLGDDSPFDERMNPAKTLIKRWSARELGRRRAAMVAELHRAGLEPRVVNGGGSGSLDTTTPETGVNEVTAGSAFFKPHLFDYYKNPHMRALEPAAFFALEVTRAPAPGLVTCLGGGYIASGPTGPDKAPLPWLPRGLSYLKAEMAGEVQTPLLLPHGLELGLGAPVIFRHAKGGELAERFNEVLLLSAGRITGRVPTYRGQGKCFI